MFGEVKNPTPIAWKMIDRCPGMTEVPKDGERVYQFVIEDLGVATMPTSSMFFHLFYSCLAFMNWVLLLEVSF